MNFLKRENVGIEGVYIYFLFVLLFIQHHVGSNLTVAKNCNLLYKLLVRTSIVPNTYF